MRIRGRDGEAYPGRRGEGSGKGRGIGMEQLRTSVGREGRACRPGEVRERG